MMAFQIPSAATSFKQRSGSAVQTPNTVASAVLERHNVIRQSTPDSEAIASSDDDHEVNPRLTQSAQLVSSRQVNPRTGRRASWLSEVSSSQAQRKKSLGGLSQTDVGGPSGGAGASQPSTPHGDHSSGLGSATYFANPFSSTPRSLNRPSTLGMGIAAPSPTSAAFDDLRSPMSQAHTSYSGLGVPIPTEPLRKTIRSQSYSAGQLEESGIERFRGFGPGRGRNGPTHRASRPSLLGDGSQLHSLQEDEDDESNDSFDMGVTPGLFSSQFSLTNPSSTLGLPPRRGTMPVTRNIDFDTDPYEEEDDDKTPRNQSLSTVRGSLFPTVGEPGFSSSFAHGPADDPSQSRRHSLATIHRARNGSMIRTGAEALPARQASVDFGSLNQPQPVQSLSVGHNFRHRDPSPNAAYQNAMQKQSLSMEQERGVMDYSANDRSFAASYFSGAANVNRHVLEQPPESMDNYVVPQVYARPGRTLFIVSFKCARADIYYVADTMGLQLRVGDTVIVEGDRGADLGTIEHVDVTMEEAKRLKQQFNKQHFKNLMMFSRLFPHMAALANNDELLDQHFGQSASSSNVPGLTGPLEQEPRPKAIKRIANPDEVHLLREKEGNEAKAKRLCQNKTSEHGLRMEVLDAEFQHDYKKLTFFYYAEEYINFNDLVTDLFKIYKTRIWMSAINAASHSLMNPNHSMRPPPHPRAGHTGTYNNSHGRGQQHQHQHQHQHQQQHSFNTDNGQDYAMLTAGMSGLTVGSGGGGGAGAGAGGGVGGHHHTGRPQSSGAPPMTASPSMPMSMPTNRVPSRGYGGSPYDANPWGPPGPYAPSSAAYGFPQGPPPPQAMPPGAAGVGGMPAGFPGFASQYNGAAMTFTPGSMPRR